MARSMLNFNLQDNHDNDSPVEDIAQQILEPVDSNNDDYLTGTTVLPVTDVSVEPENDSDPSSVPQREESSLRGEEAMQTLKRRNSRRTSADDGMSPEEQFERSSQELYASSFPAWDLLPPQVLIRRVSRKK